jgi:hypothetical protein
MADEPTFEGEDLADQHDAAATADVKEPKATASDDAPSQKPDVEEGDPNEGVLEAQPEPGTEIAVPSATVDAEAPEEPTVSLVVNADFTVPVLEEYQDDKGRPRGRVKGYEAPTDLRVYSAAAPPDADYVDEDGYVTLPATVPASVASDLLTSPAVEAKD